MVKLKKKRKKKERDKKKEECVRPNSKSMIGSQRNGTPFYFITQSETKEEEAEILEGEEVFFHCLYLRPHHFHPPFLILFLSAKLGTSSPHHVCWVCLLDLNSLLGTACFIHGFQAMAVPCSFLSSSWDLLGHRRWRSWTSMWPYPHCRCCH